MQFPPVRLMNKLTLTIEVSIIGDPTRNLFPRHSGEGRNPAGLFNML